MKILIVGGGIGGLALAQALKKSGIQVNVFERDASAMARLQGYSIFITGLGVKALRTCQLKSMMGTTPLKTAAYVIGLDGWSEHDAPLYSSY